MTLRAGLDVNSEKNLNLMGGFCIVFTHMKKFTFSLDKLRGFVVP